MTKPLMWALCLGAGMALWLPASGAEGDGTGASVAQAFKDGTFKIDFRYRLESVDQDLVPQDATASTLRTRLTYQTAKFNDFGLLLEVDDLRTLVSSDYNSTRNGKGTRPVVADPAGTDVNQAAIRFTGFDDTPITLGRQRINRTNQRFVGGVGWRQNEQTYDAFALNHTVNEDLTVFYSYVNQVKRIFGPDSGTPAASLDTNSHLLDLSYQLQDNINVTGYMYLLDFDDAASLSNRTFGVRLAGSTELSGGDLGFKYQAEFAQQSDAGDNLNSYDANYLLLEGALAFSAVDLKLGYEVLQGDGVPNQRFQTPLATLHKFQGWADKFLSTPAGGIEDFYVGVSGKVFNATYNVIYHDFSAETGGGSYGDEIDASLQWKFGEHYGLLLKLAHYSADSFATDTKKYWVMFTAGF
ncbi:MAG: alginate export family protein [Gammaproteobacteria bacterium]|nr:alginate export family protein [Gammaproteobacteria bacterium]